MRRWIIFSICLIFLTTHSYAQRIRVTSEAQHPLRHKAQRIYVDTDNFDGILSGVNTTVQSSFESLDDILSKVPADMIPDEDNTYDIGEDDTPLEWKDIYIDSTAYIDAFGHNMLPDGDAGYDLGSSLVEWKDLHIDGNAYIDTFAQDILPNLDEEYDIGSSSFRFDNLHVKHVIADQVTATLVGSSEDTLDAVCERNPVTNEPVNVTNTLTADAFTSTGLGTFGQLDVDSIGINVNQVTSDTGEISFNDENLVTSGNITATNITATDTLAALTNLSVNNLTIDNNLYVINTAEIDDTLNLATGSITDDSGNISFGNENLTTTNIITAGKLTADNISIDSNVITSDTGTVSLDNENLTTSGTITAEQITSNDDANISGTLTVGTLTDGTVSITGGNISGVSTLSAADVITTDDLIVGDKVTVDSTLELTSGNISDTGGSLNFGNTNLTMGGTTTMGGTLSVVGNVTLGSVTTGNVKPQTDLAFEVGGQSTRYQRVYAQEFCFDSDTCFTFDGTTIFVVVNGVIKKSWSQASSEIENVVYDAGSGNENVFYDAGSGLEQVVYTGG